MTMAVKRRLSPTTILSLRGTVGNNTGTGTGFISSSSMSVATVSSNSSSTALNSDSGRDEIVPLYSEQFPHNHHHHHHHHSYYSSSTATNTAATQPPSIMSGASTGSSYDYESHDDDMSSTCSPPSASTYQHLPQQQQQQQQPHNYSNRRDAARYYFGRSASSSASVVSEPCLLPHHWSAAESSSSVANNTAMSAVSAAAASASTSGTRLVFTAKKRKNPLYILVAAFSFLGMFLYSQSHATLHDALEQVLTIMEQRRLVRAQFHSVEQDIRHLQQEMRTLTKDAAASAAAAEKLPNSSSSSSNSGAVEEDAAIIAAQEINALQTKLHEGSTQIGMLQKHLQEISKKDALTKYGGGKIRVQLEIEFPEDMKQNKNKQQQQPPPPPPAHHPHLHNGAVASPSADSAGGDSSPLLLLPKNTIVMEMAPLDLMPHSVYMFLEMVDAKLFDGCSFILNAMHVIKAAPLPYDGSSAAAKVRSFAQKGLDSVAFREYSADYPHAAYTVAFAADESPSFYINTQDNADIHIGEPCFATIVAGFDTVRRMEAAPTRNGIWYRQRIGIRRATIL